ncbi:hypothetical protein [Halorhodospira halochloris]|uniref:hypothetical protein n=1 Tax=Halorhodospira halochloris TaxID=1052 RepID=UPI0013A599D3|nr:hypothetical protein [Halorhodospira halochloris]
MNPSLEASWRHPWRHEASTPGQPRRREVFKDSSKGLWTPKRCPLLVSCAHRTLY